jgi:hypothetical protein
MPIFVVHVYDCDADTKVIGAYSTHEAAKQAAEAFYLGNYEEALEWQSRDYSADMIGDLPTFCSNPDEPFMMFITQAELDE